MMTLKVCLPFFVDKMDDENLMSLNIFFNESERDDMDVDSSTNSKSTSKVDVKELKKTVGTLMHEKSDRLKFAKRIVKAPKMGKVSEVWDKFEQAVIDEKPINIYRCNQCPTLFYYTPETGNTAMKRHVCNGKNRIKCIFQHCSVYQCLQILSGKKVVNTKGVQKIDKFLSKTPPVESIRKLNRDITIGLAVDLEPLYRVEGQGFLHICQSLINFGATYGHHTVKDVIQHRTTLKRSHVPVICAEMRDDLKKSLLAAPSYPKFAFSKDMWSEKYNSVHFLSLTAHFIDITWNLQTVTLGLEEVNDVKTTENIRKECRCILKRYFDDDTDLVMEHSTSTTDGGSNMLKVLQRRLPCQCHKLNLFLKWTFNEKKIPSKEKVDKRIAKKKPPFNPKKFFNFSKECPEMFKCTEGVRHLVTYFKQSNLNSQLTTTLKQTVSTRWNTELLMLEAYQKSAVEVREILSKNEKVEKLMFVKDAIVQELIQFLTPFRDCSETLSGNKYPTIQLVTLYYYELQQHIKIRDGDSEEMKALKKQAEICFKEYLVPGDIYYAATMLDPR